MKHFEIGDKVKTKTGITGYIWTSVFRSDDERGITATYHLLNCSMIKDGRKYKMIGLFCYDGDQLEKSE
jgi:hypothetical protein